MKLNCGFVMNFCSVCSVFSKGTQTFDFIKHNKIYILTYKVKYSQTNESFDHVFYKFKNIYFLIIWLNCEQYGKNQ